MRSVRTHARSPKWKIHIFSLVVGQLWLNGTYENVYREFGQRESIPQEEDMARGLD